MFQTFCLETLPLIVIEPQDLLDDIKGPTPLKAYCLYGHEAIMSVLVQEIKQHCSWTSGNKGPTLFSHAPRVSFFQGTWKDLASVVDDQGSVVAFDNQSPPDALKSHPWGWVPCYGLKPQGLRHLLERWLDHHHVQASQEVMDVWMNHPQWFCLLWALPLFSHAILDKASLDTLLPTCPSFIFNPRFWQGILVQALAHKRTSTLAFSRDRDLVLALARSTLPDLQAALWACQKLTRSTKPPLPEAVARVLANVLKDNHKIFGHACVGGTPLNLDADQTIGQVKRF